MSSGVLRHPATARANCLTAAARSDPYPRGAGHLPRHRSEPAECGVVPRPRVSHAGAAPMERPEQVDEAALRHVGRQHLWLMAWGSLLVFAAGVGLVPGLFVPVALPLHGYWVDGLVLADRAGVPRRLGQGEAAPAPRGVRRRGVARAVWHRCDDGRRRPGWMAVVARHVELGARSLRGGLASRAGGVERGPSWRCWPCCLPWHSRSFQPGRASLLRRRCPARQCCSVLGPWCLQSLVCSTWESTRWFRLWTSSRPFPRALRRLPSRERRRWSRSWGPARPAT